jgi:23S rRNA (adenine2503-C2)-methyltransferase
MINLNILTRVDSTIDDVTKYVIEDDTFGKNEVSIIRKSDKIIFCVPTQTNCKMGRTFCHLTGTTRKAKNLTAEWIDSVVDCLVEAEQIHLYPVDLLISFMGVGEPLLNVSNLMGVVEILHDKYPDIRFGVSTMTPNIRAINKLTDWLLANPDYRVKVHLSVHGIFNRDSIVKTPVSIEMAIKHLQTYHKLTDQPIEYHYTLVDGVNDSVDELKAFNSLIEHDGATVKFLTLSETNGCKATKLTEEEITITFPKNIVEFYDPPGEM